MKVTHYTDIPAEDVDREDAQGVRMRWVISDKDGAPTFAMRIFEVQPGGYTPLHAHPWEHEVFVLGGCGLVVDEGDETPVSAGDTVFVAPNEKHQFRNTGDEPLEFICLIPHTT